MSEDISEDIVPRSRSSLLSGPLLGPVLRLSFPTVLANVLQSGFVLVDMWFVGRLGTEALAAISVSGVIMSVVFPFVIGLTVGSNALISRASGSGDRSALNRTIFTMLALAAGVSLLIAAAGLALSDWIIGLFGLEPQVHEMALAYIRILFGGSVFMVSLFLVNAVLRALGDAITPFVVLVISTIVNFALDPLLIFGPGPFPALGVSGAAIASVIARAVGLSIAAVFLARRYMPRPLFSLDYLSVSVIGRVLAIGLPSSISMATRHLSGLIVTAMVVQFGTAAVAAYGVCQRITFLVLMPGFGFAIGAAVLVGQNLGAGNPRRAELSSWIACGSYALLVLVASAVLWLVPGPVVSLFDSTAEVVRLGAAFFAIVAPSLLLLPLGVVLSRSMSGAGYTFWPMVISVTVLLGVRVPLAWMLSASMGMQGIFWAIAVPVVIEGTMMTGLFVVGGWKNKKVG